MSVVDTLLLHNQSYVQKVKPDHFICNLLLTNRNNKISLSLSAYNLDTYYETSVFKL